MSTEQKSKGMEAELENLITTTDEFQVTLFRQSFKTFWDSILDGLLVGFHILF